MYKFDHPNVLKLIGVCLDGGPAPYIIMPFMINGSLLSHLKQNRDTLVVDTETAEYDEDVVVSGKFRFNEVVLIVILNRLKLKRSC